MKQVEKSQKSREYILEYAFAEFAEQGYLGASVNILLDPVFMFDWGLNMGVEGASLATTVSQFVTFLILAWFYLSGRSVIRLRLSALRPSRLPTY